MSFNRLTAQIPTEIGRLATLVELYVNNNNLQGTIPTEVPSSCRFYKETPILLLLYRSAP
jgi:hypothetical protein